MQNDYYGILIQDQKVEGSNGSNIALWNNTAIFGETPIAFLSIVSSRRTVALEQQPQELYGAKIEL